MNVFAIFALSAVAVGVCLHFAIRLLCRLRASRGVQLEGSAAQYARIMLDENRLNNVAISCGGSPLDDHFDENGNAIRLSSAVYGSNSAAAAAIACHECGHALQVGSQGPAFPRSVWASRLKRGCACLWLVVLVVGIVFDIGSVCLAGVVLFVLALVFQIALLPVEFDASRRALAFLDNWLLGYSLHDDALSDARATLSLAYLSYLASILAGVILPARALVRLFND